jgi:hypothetical protein
MLHQAPGNTWFHWGSKSDSVYRTCTPRNLQKGILGGAYRARKLTAVPFGACHWVQGLGFAEGIGQIVFELNNILICEWGVV